ncbi:putative T7SS-secreted protein [Streptomyces sp. NPDC088116]|uniref:putative T7SS-secreted protein n=1 Tax=Streptomyces sp. NPDC088116 TaxID=3365825 RepID=UPI00382A7C29
MSGAGGVDWGGLAEKGLGKAEEVWDEGKRKVGEGVDWATDRTGSVLERLDHHAVADVVEDWGDRTASSLGAKVGEQQLGESEEADELIHGRAGDIAASVKNLRDFGAAFDLVGQGLKSLDSGHWKGEAAEAFRERFQSLPTDWLHAADAFEDAAGALETYAKTVTWAQGEAREAVALYKEGEAASRSARAAWDKERVAHEESLAGDAPLPDPGGFTDPGDAKRKRAQEILAGARSQRDEDAGTAKRAVTAALAHAPAEPSATERAKFNLDDFSVAQGVERTHMVSGIAKGTVGIVSFVRAVNPQDPYNVTHPAEYYRSVNMTLAGLASTAAHPDRALKGAWEALKSDPAEFGGRLVPELATTKGAGAGLRAGLRAGVKDPVKAGPSDGPLEGPQRPARERVTEDPQEPAREHDHKKCVEDPVDVATGRMVLPQTDITLPGSLPLVFRRVFESSYRAGRWFGPTWASTVDQRLEIDSEGIVLVREDGSLLAYPHPAPGVPVLPFHGQRRPLDRTDDGYTVTDPETGRVQHFADRGEDLALLVQIDDRNGRWIAFEYDETGAPTSIVHHGGYHLKLTTDHERVTALHLAGAAPDGTDQEILRYGYTEGHLTEVTNSSGRPLRFGYDECGRITSWTDTNDSRFDYVYDSRDRCTFQTGAEGHLRSTFEYGTTDGADRTDRTAPETGLRVTTLTNSLGHTSRFLINEDVQVVAEIDPTGAVTRFEYDRFNRLLSRTDPLGRTTGLHYDDHGNLTAVARPDGRTSSAAYNALGLPTTVRGTDGTTWRQSHDERGNRTSVTAPTGALTSYTYDEAGHVTSVTNALGDTTRLRCDRAGLVVEAIDPLGAVIRYERDGFGRPVAVIDPLGAVSRLEWTREGKLSRRTDADGTGEFWTYDGEGNCLTHTDALGAVSRFEYGHFDLLTARTGPDGARYEFAYDTDLVLTRVTNPQGLSWQYAYDPAGHLTSETDFDGRTLTYTHDAAGALLSRTNGLGQTISYERDALGRATSKNAEGAITTYEYDLTDALTRSVGPDTTLTLLRDRFGRLTSETVADRTASYTYDVLGRRTSRTTPAGATGEWAYDAAGNRTGLTASGRALTFELDAAGNELTRHIGDTITLTSQWDVVGRLSAQSVHGPGTDPLQHRAYTYRADGNLTGIDDQLSGTQRFDLDAAGRVTAVHAANWTERYAYDEAGNQTEASWPTSHPGTESSGPRVYTGTRITRAGDVRYEHDAQGRITLRRKTRLSRKPDTWRYTWDAEDRLTSVTTPDGTRWRYLYDPLGRRIAKQRLAPDSTTVEEQVDFTWDGATLCEQTTRSPDLPHPVTLTWHHHGLRPLAQTERITTPDTPQDEIDERFFAIVTDLVGTPTELIDETGTIAWHTRTTLWGTTTWNTSATAYTPLRFPGQYFDPETGLHYNFHRHYDPEIGRYLTPDPLGLKPAPNPAAYVHNPHTWADPLGLSPCPHPSRSDAKTQALKDAGVPDGQEPFDSDDWVPATTPAWQGGKQLLGEDHQPIFYREEWYETPSGDIVVFQDHWFGHQKPGEPGHQGPHVHVRPYENTRNGQIPGAEEHYYYDPDLG